DLSSNGTVLNAQQLPKDVWVELKDEMQEIDFGAGAVLYLCRNFQDEQLLLGDSDSSLVDNVNDSEDQRYLDKNEDLDKKPLNQEAKFNSEPKLGLPIDSNRGIKQRKNNDRVVASHLRSIATETVLVRSFTFACFCILVGF